MGSEGADISPNVLVAGFHTRNSLPHLKREGGTYFVTIRLAGTLPAELVERLKRERELILAKALAAKRPLTWQEQLQLFDWYSTRVDAYLDAGHGDCLLARPEIADIVAAAFRFFEGERYDLYAWVVMPNHGHVVVRPRPPHTLSDILHSWKSYTGSEANKLLSRVGQPFWQKEAYDHLLRDDADLARCCHYTDWNPVNAGLCQQPEDWRWSSAHRSEPLRKFPR